MTEQTLVLVKPDGVCQKRTGSILERFESSGLTLRGLKMKQLNRNQAESFYQDHKGKPFLEGLLTFMTSAPVVAAVWEGSQAISLVRQIIGATNSPAAEPGTLRRQYGLDQRHNLVHASDSPASAAREIPFFFSADELYRYGAEDWKAALKS